MTDAALGLSVDSSQVVKGTVDLDKLAASAAKAQASAEKLGNSSNSAFKKIAADAPKSEQALKGTSFQTANIAAQFQDIAVQLQSGQSPFQIALQQGTQLSAALGGQGGVKSTLAALASGFTSMVSPVSLLTIGFIALGGAAVQYLGTLAGGSAASAEEALQRQKDLIDDIAAAYPAAGEALKTFLKQADTATPSEIVVRSLQQIKDAQKEVERLTVELNALTANGGGGRSGPSNPLAFTPELLAQVRQAVSLFEAGTDSAQMLREKLFALELNPDLSDATRLVLDRFAQIAGKIAEADTNAKAFASTMEYFRQQGGLIIGGDFDQLGGDTAKAYDALKSVIDSGVSQKDRLTKMVQQAIGGAVSLGDQQNLQNMLDQALKVLDQKSGIALAKQFDTTADAIERQTAALVAEAASYGQGIQQVEAAKIAEQLLTSAKQDHLALSPKLVAQIDAEAAAYGRAALAAKEAQVLGDLAFQRSQLGRSPIDQDVAAQVRALYGDDVLSAGAKFLAQQVQVTDSLKDLATTGLSLTRGFLSTLKTDLMQGVSLWGAFEDAGAKALGSIADKALDLASQGIINLIFGALTGAIGGGLTPQPVTNIGFGAYGAYANGGVIAGMGISRFSSSVVDKPTVFPMARGMGLIGEAGPEAVLPLRRGSDGKLGVAANNNVVRPADVARAEVVVRLDPGLIAQIRQNAAGDAKEIAIKVVDAQAPVAVARRQRFRG